MSFQTRPPAAPVLPHDAPFNAEQRNWLNGFFAGVLWQESGDAAFTPVDAPAMLAAPADASEEEITWHDPSLPIEDRMKLASGRNLGSRMMAAMAQQDCGQCGYICADYAKAIVTRTEAKLNLCAPGGKETARMLKALHAELAGSAAPAPAPVATEPAPAAAPAKTAQGATRYRPATASLLSRTRLNPGSAKETLHIEIDLAACGVTYEVGDSLGLFPANDPALVEAVLQAVRADGSFPIAGKTFREVLGEDMSLGAAPDMLFTLLSYITGGARRDKAKALAIGEDPDGDAATLDVLAALQKFPGIHPDPEALVECLEPLAPRLYSISSSPRANPGRVALTVDCVRYEAGERQRLGVASTFLADRAAPGAPLKVYVQKAHGFSLPANGATPIIMVGPGTGVAPFRAFLQERLVAQASGKAWLFFGHQKEATDFFYRDEFEAMQAQGALTNLSAAWSRDGASKVYVQDKMREAGAELWQWLEAGAHFYVCGDALKMAKDVETALAEIIAAHGGKSADEAKAFVAVLKKAGRYQADVY